MRQRAVTRSRLHFGVFAAAVVMLIAKCVLSPPLDQGCLNAKLRRHFREVEADVGDGYNIHKSLFPLVFSQQIGIKGPQLTSLQRFFFHFILSLDSLIQTGIRQHESLRDKHTSLCFTQIFTASCGFYKTGQEQTKPTCVNVVDPLVSATKISLMCIFQSLIERLDSKDVRPVMKILGTNIEYSL